MKLPRTVTHVQSSIRLSNLAGGGEVPSASSGFFWPTEGFLGGVLLLLFPAVDVPEGARGPN